MSDEESRKALLKALGGRTQSYFERRRDDLLHLETALDRLDFGAVHRIGHNLCGSGGMYGFDRLSSLGEALEEAARERSVDQVRALMQAYEAELRDAAMTTGQPDADPSRPT